MRKKTVKLAAKDGDIYDTLSNPAIFADLFNGSMFGGKQILHADMLYPYNEKKQQRIYTGKKKPVILMRTRDNQRVATFPETQFAVIFSSENQRKVHYAMPVRNMLYDGMDYKHQIDNYSNDHHVKKDWGGTAEFLSGLNKEDKLIPVLTIVFYYGEKPWDGPKRLHDMITFPPTLLPWKDYFADYKLNLVSCSTVDYRNFKTGLLEVFELLRFADSDQRMEDFLEQRKEHYEHLDGPTCDLISRFLDIPTLDNQNIGDITPKGGINMCTAIKQMVSKGESKGRADGISVADERYSQLLKILLKDKRFQDIERISEDGTFRQKLYHQFGLM